jgi:hypothetical protein
VDGVFRFNTEVGIGDGVAELTKGPVDAGDASGAVRGAHEEPVEAFISWEGPQSLAGGPLGAAPVTVIQAGLGELFGGGDDLGGEHAAVLGDPGVAAAGSGERLAVNEGEGIGEEVCSDAGLLVGEGGGAFDKVVEQVVVGGNRR